MEDSIKKRVDKFKDWKVEDIFEYCSSLRYNGTPMLINRTIREFAAFVEDSIFDPDSKESALVSAYGIVSKSKNEAERYRMWVIMFAIWCEDEYK